VAFLTAKATAEMQATLLDGFWWFLSFCILSIISGQLLAQHRLLK
jgi:short subunit fatty acids transporter